ncbi:hypothetical protein DFP72DRAFT_857836 [Ephemerocybe angulata]|uniref:Uncharacterized protein n=1 Tax=Ephemerocybe angulata TaxID=980116 RepID=A0A8H6HDF6_9AGAR|nr:hypothetical protein DFP72DRAFT_857836 [Tulosesus angulatus]
MSLSGLPGISSKSYMPDTVNHQYRIASVLPVPSVPQCTVEDVPPPSNFDFYMADSLRHRKLERRRGGSHRVVLVEGDVGHRNAQRWQCVRVWQRFRVKFGSVKHTMRLAPSRYYDSYHQGAHVKPLRLQFIRFRIYKSLRPLKTLINLPHSMSITAEYIWDVNSLLQVANEHPLYVPT